MIYITATPSESPSVSSAPTYYSDTPVTSHAPTRSITSFSYHLFTTNIPGICTVSLQRSRVGRIEMYCASILCLISTHADTSSNPASCIAVSKCGYYQLPSRNRDLIEPFTY